MELVIVRSVAVLFCSSSFAAPQQPGYPPQPHMQPYPPQQGYRTVLDCLVQARSHSCFVSQRRPGTRRSQCSRCTCSRPDILPVTVPRTGTLRHTQSITARPSSRSRRDTSPRSICVSLCLCVRFLLVGLQKFKGYKHKGYKAKKFKSGKMKVKSEEKSLSSFTRLFVAVQTLNPQFCFVIFVQSLLPFYTAFRASL